MMKILIKWIDADGFSHFNTYEADGGYIFDADGFSHFNTYEADGGYIFDKDMGDFNNVEYIMIWEVKDE